MNTTRIDYRGKIIHVGIDVHKRTYSVTAICDGLIVKRDTIGASPAGLVAYLRRCFSAARIRSAYEAGFSGFVLHRVLVQSGVENIVVNPRRLRLPPMTWSRPISVTPGSWLSNSVPGD